MARTFREPAVVFIEAVHYHGPVPALRGWKAIFDRAKKAAYYAMGLLWHTGIRPGHFTRAGAQRYGYAPREGEAGNTNRYGFRKSYTGQKLRRYHHTDPLKLSGRSQRATRTARITSTSRGARMVFDAEHLGVKRANLPDMEAEFTTIDRADADQLAAEWARQMEAELAWVNTIETYPIFL